MLVALLVLVFLCFVSSLFRTEAGGEEPKYLSRTYTSMINGIFIWLVFIRHIGQYQPQVNEWDAWILMHEGSFLGQLIVAPFFFFSGWGMMNSFNRKGRSYARSLASKRFFGVLFKFVIAVWVFLGVQFLCGEYYTWERIMLSMLGWRSVGNSCWFIFMSLLMYIVVAATFAIIPFKRNSIICIVNVGLLLSVVVYIMGIYKPSYWYDTIMCLPAGMLWYVLAQRCSIKMLKLCGYLALIFIPVGWWLHHHSGEITVNMPILSFWSGNMLANCGALLFAWGIALVAGSLSLRSFRLSIGARCLVWCGGPALFYLYIYQRIPMLVGVHVSMNHYAPLLYCACCVLITILIAVCCGQVHRLMSFVLYKRRVE